jgi:hypothetical protein
MKLRFLILGLSFMFVACGSGQHSFAPLDSPDAATDRGTLGDAADAPAAQDAAVVDGTSTDVAGPGADAGLDTAVPGTDAGQDAGTTTDASVDGSSGDLGVG